jgi:hypothetical protein
MLAFAISGSVSLSFGNREFTSLQAWDLAVASPHDRGEVTPASFDEFPLPLVFFATLDDNSP